VAVPLNILAAIFGVFCIYFHPLFFHFVLFLQVNGGAGPEVNRGRGVAGIGWNWLEKAGKGWKRCSSEDGPAFARGFGGQARPAKRDFGEASGWRINNGPPGGS
jgi:hypothetical protein